jgi:hypothetical protein
MYPSLRCVFVECRVYPPHLLSFQLFQGVNAAAEQTGPSGLQVVNSPGDCIDATAAVGIEPDTYIEIGYEVKGRQAIEEVAALNSVNGTKGDITLCGRKKSLS